MIDERLIDLTVRKMNISDRILIEKDILLHMILNELVKDKKFKEDFVFKGGTCLTKCYYGYYRFSEDLDFTYIAEALNNRMLPRNSQRTKLYGN